MIKKFICAYFAIIVTFLPPIVLADNITGLYEAETVVTSQAEKTRNQAMGKILTDVLVKISGNPNIATQTAVKDQLKNAPQLVLQYGYKQQVEGTYTLNAKFNPQQVNDLLRKANQPIWGQERPSTLFWLVVEDEQGKQIYGIDTDENITQLVNSAAKARGVSLMLPMLDLEDMNSLSISELLSPSVWAIQEASKRYASQAEVIARITKDTTQEPAIWYSQWLLLLDNSKINFDQEGSDLNQVIKKGLDKMVDTMSAKYAILTTDQTESQLLLGIYGVKGLDGYAKLNEHLKNLSVINELEVQTVGQDYVIFIVSVIGGEDALLQALNADRMLTPIDLTSSNNDFETNLNYRMVT